MTRGLAVTASVARAGGSVTALVVCYYVVPFDQPLGYGTWVKFVLGLLLFAVVIGWQVRAVLHSDMPRLRALEALAVGLPLLLLLFASMYFVIARAAPDSFTQHLGRTDALYFALSTFTTVGFGDIAPRTETARIVTMIQMIVGLIVVGLVVRTVLGAVQVAVRRRDNGD